MVTIMSSWEKVSHAKFLHCFNERNAVCLSNFCTPPIFSCVEFIISHARLPVGARNKFTNRRRDHFDDSSLWMKPRSIYGRGRGGSGHTPSIRVSFKCLQASSCKIYSGIKRFEGAKVRKCKLWARGERNDGGPQWSRALLCASFVVRENRSAEVCPRHYISADLLRPSD